MGTLIDLAPLAALLAAFACWIDRRIGRCFDDLESDFRAAHEQTCKRLDDLGQRFDNLGQRFDDLESDFRAAHERTLKRFGDPRAAADRRSGP